MGSLTENPEESIFEGPQKRPPTRIPRGPHNTAVVAPAPLRSFRRPHARLYHVVRHVTRNFMHSVELDSHFNILISMLINMLKSKMV
jgi:hypothetical protein